MTTQSMPICTSLTSLLSLIHNFNYFEVILFIVFISFPFNIQVKYLMNLLTRLEGH